MAALSSLPLQSLSPEQLPGDMAGLSHPVNYFVCRTCSLVRACTNRIKDEQKIILFLLNKNDVSPKPGELAQPGTHPEEVLLHPQKLAQEVRDSPTFKLNSPPTTNVGLILTNETFTSCKHHKMDNK